MNGSVTKGIYRRVCPFCVGGDAPGVRIHFYPVSASGVCECSSFTQAACWGSTPDPSEHDPHAAVRVCLTNTAQISRTVSVRSMGLGCCPTRCIGGYGYPDALLATTVRQIKVGEHNKPLCRCSERTRSWSEVSQNNVFDKTGEIKPKNGQLFRLTDRGLMKYNTYG